MIKEFSFRGMTYKVACLDDYPSHPSWWTFEDEASVRDAYWNITSGEVILDIGAAYGSYAVTALLQGAAYVYAWNPLLFETELFHQTLGLNDGWTSKCTIIESGVYNKDGFLNTVTQEFSKSPPDSPNQDIIQVSTIDSWMESTKLDRVDWVKIDVEGAEIEVLKGAQNLIKTFRPKVLCENHNFKRATLEEEVRQLLISGELGTKYKEISTTPYHSVSHSLYTPV